MYDRFRTLINYSVVFIILFVIYHFATGFTLVIVDEGYTQMEPTLEEQSTFFMDRRESQMSSLTTDALIVFKVNAEGQEKRMFGRVLATPGMTVSVQGGQLLVDGKQAASTPSSVQVLETGLIVPREMVFIGFDSPRAGNLSLAQRLVPCRNIIGRIMGK